MSLVVKVMTAKASKARVLTLACTSLHQVPLSIVFSSHICNRAKAQSASNRIVSLQSHEMYELMWQHFGVQMLADLCRISCGKRWMLHFETLSGSAGRCQESQKFAQ